MIHSDRGNMDVAVKEKSEVIMLSTGCIVFVVIDIKDATNIEINKFR